MALKNEIKSEKILVKNIFSNLWFRIPEYQRPFVWGKDEIIDLLDDLDYAHQSKSDQEYFLGSFVFQAKKLLTSDRFDYIENDLLDGQQRLTTLLLLFACIRDLSSDKDVKKACISFIFQEGNSIKQIPEKTRITYAVRETVQDFINNFVKKDEGTTLKQQIENHAQKDEDLSCRNMAKAILEIHEYLNKNKIDLVKFLTFISNNVLLIYVSTDNLDDAFRLFTILNNRGVPLRNSDILKSQNLGVLNSLEEKNKYAKIWEEAENELGENFDRFLNHIRTILVKEKARKNLLDEFEQNIYESELLKKGKETFELVKKYLNYYNTLFDNDNYQNTGNNYKFDNLIKILLIGLPSSEWVPPLLLFYSKFNNEKLLDFLKLLDNKFSADWIVQLTPTTRIENMNQILKIIEESTDANQILCNDCFQIDTNSFNRCINEAIYGKRFTRYLLLKLDYIYHDHSHKMSLETLSIEHILPQTPAENSQWLLDFTEEERREWTDRIGNLVLISTRKNTSQGRLDYREKKDKYFKIRINSCPNSLRVFNNYNQWKMSDLRKNDNEVLSEIKKCYRSSE